MSIALSTPMTTLSGDPEMKQQQCCQSTARAHCLPLTGPLNRVPFASRKLRHLAEQSRIHQSPWCLCVISLEEHDTGRCPAEHGGKRTGGRVPGAQAGVPVEHRAAIVHGGHSCAAHRRREGEYRTSDADGLPVPPCSCAKPWLMLSSLKQARLPPPVDTHRSLEQGQRSDSSAQLSQVCLAPGQQHSLHPASTGQRTLQLCKPIGAATAPPAHPCTVLYGLSGHPPLAVSSEPLQLPETNGFGS